MRTPIHQQREIVRLIAKGSVSDRTAAKLVNVTHKTISSVRTKLQQCSLSPTELLSLSDSEFQRHLGTENRTIQTDKIVPDWEDVQRQLQLKDMTLSLLWEEYRYENRDQIDLCLGYSRFSQCYRSWLNRQKISMRQLHKPGDKLFIDFCGRTVPVHDRQKGDIYQAYIFVAVLGASGLMFVYATPSMKSSDWIRGCVEAFEYFNGATEHLIPDNPKSTVIKNTSTKIVINREFADFARHYDVVVFPARPRKPKDKSLAEIGVQIVQRWLLAAMRNRIFFSLDELNEAIREKLNELNKRQTKTYPLGREARFAEIEQNAMRPLPLERYEPAEWVYKVRVPADYHIPFGGCYYSVPYQHVKSLVDLRVTDRIIEILLEGTRIASHELICGEHAISRKAEHMPAQHLHQTLESPELLLEWAKNIGENVLEWATKNIKKRSDYANGVKSVSCLRKWVRIEKNQDRLDSACRFALEIDVLSFKRLQNIIIRNADLQLREVSQSKVILHENIRGADYFTVEQLNHAE